MASERPWSRLVEVTRAASRFGGVLACVALLAAPAAADVVIEVAPDGSRVMHNRGERQRPRRGPSFSGRQLSRDALAPVVERNAIRNALDPELVWAVIRIESDFDPRARSYKGAMGLMQLMPETARELAVDDPYDPEQNVRGGTTYLRAMLDAFGGELVLALAGYNAGPEAVRRFSGVPPYPETRDYVEKVLRVYRRDPGFSLGDSPLLRVGRKTYLARDARGRLVMTTEPPAAR